MLGALPHVQSAQFGQIDELRALLDETPELIDQADGRGMTALMAAAHGGHAAVVAMLLERGADVTSRDGHGVSALEYAIREDRQEVALAILDHAGDVVNAVGPRGTTALLVACEYRREAIARALLDRGAKVDALKTRLNFESATMLAKIGTEKGIMLFGIKRDQKEADFRNQGLGPGDAILLASDLANSLLSECNVRGNNFDMEAANVLAKIGIEKGIMLFGIKRDQKEADFQKQRLGPKTPSSFRRTLSQAH
jgi:ankyrin repeat protein